MLNKHFKIHTLITYGANAIVMGSGFVLMFVINRYAGVETYGTLAIIISTAGIIASILTARSGEAVTRFFIREKVHKNLENAKLIVLIGLCVDVILSLFIFLFFYLLSNTIANHFLNRPQLSFSVWIYGFITISTMIRGSMIGYFQSHEYFKVINSIQVLESTLKVLFLIIAFFVLNHININYIIYSYILASFTVTLYVVVIFLNRFIKEFKSIKIEKNVALIKEYFVFNSKTFLSTTVSSINNSIDNLLLGYFTDTKIVGIYQTLKNILSPTSFIVSPFIMMTISKLTILYTQKKKNNFINLIKKITIPIIYLNMVIISIIFYFLQDILFYLNIKEILFFEFFLYAIMVLFKRIIWWNAIVINLYNPFALVYQSLIYFISFIGILIIINYFYNVSINTILISGTISTILLVILSFDILKKILKKMDE